MYLRKAAFGITSKLVKSLAMIEAVLLPLNNIESSPKSDFVSRVHIVLDFYRTEPNLKKVNETLTAQVPKTTT